MKINLFNFTNIYEQEDFYTEYPHTKYDLSTIPSTNCYCDDEAVDSIKGILESIKIGDINFIDSGNYHYMSKLTTDKLKGTFNLVVFDNHSDMQTPQFGDILSCGGWIRKVLESNNNVNHVFIIGVRPDLAAQIPQEYNDKVTCITPLQITNQPFINTGNTDFYLSIDKDALSEDYAVTNWDQGSLTLDQLKSIVSSFRNQSRLLGVDICGEPESESNTTHANEINNKTNKELITYLSALLP